MTPLSRWKLNQTEIEEVKKSLDKELAGISSDTEMGILLEGLLSKNERLMIGKRLLAFVLMNKGVSDVSISRQLHLTRETVKRLRVRNEHLEEMQKPMARLMDRIEKSDTIKTLLKKFVEYAIPAMGGRAPRI